MLEVLISLLIISMGILGIIGMELSALHSAQSAYLHSLASSQLTSMMERLRANLSVNSRNAEFIIWNDLNVYLLPKAKGSYSCFENVCTVEIEWNRIKLQLSSLLSDDNE